MIPRLLHQVWIGGRPMPDAYLANHAAWVAMHPRWTAFLWTDANRPTLANEWEYQHARNAAEASDILRYELVLHHGGIYLDLDIDPVRPLDGLRRHPAFAGLERPDYLCTAAVGAERHHPAFAALVAGIPESFRTGKNNLTTTGPAYMTRVMRRVGGVVELPQDTFYPYGYGEEPRPPTARTLGIHRWAASWV